MIIFAGTINVASRCL